MTAPVVRPGVLMTADYVPGEREIEGVSTPIKLSSNESPHGPGPKALEAYHLLASDLFRYPDSLSPRSQHEEVQSVLYPSAIARPWRDHD